MVEPGLEYFHSEVPAGRSGEWSIQKIVQPERISAAADTRPECFRYRPGTYTCLQRGGTQFMTDLYDEWWTQRLGITEAITRGGEILITGLGLGLVAEAILRAAGSRVSRITIIEQSPDVISLVAPFLQSRYPDSLDIINADAFTWAPSDGRRFTVGWHDIWPDPYASRNAAEMEQLALHHSTWCDWQGFWPRTYLEATAA